MTVTPVLDDWPIPRIEMVRTLEHRVFAELPIPGRVGSLFQDMNTSPTRVVITGSLCGEEDGREFLEEVRAKFRDGEPVTFVADIVTATEVQFVVIEVLEFQENGTKPDQIDYFIVLKESPPPPPPPDPLGELDASLLDEAGDFLDSVTGALDALDTLGSIPDIGDPTEPLTGALSDVSSALEQLASLTDTISSVFGDS